MHRRVERLKPARRRAEEGQKAKGGFEGTFFASVMFPVAIAAGAWRKYVLAPLTFALVIGSIPPYQAFAFGRAAAPEAQNLTDRDARLRTVVHIHDCLDCVCFRDFDQVDPIPQAEDPVYVVAVPPPPPPPPLLPPPPLPPPPPPEPPEAKPPRAPASVARKVTIGIFAGSAVAVFAGSLTLSVVAAKLREQPLVCTANGLLYACQPDFSLPQIIGYNASWLLGTVGIVRAGFR